MVHKLINELVSWPNSEMSNGLVSQLDHELTDDLVSRPNKLVNEMSNELVSQLDY